MKSKFSTLLLTAAALFAATSFTSCSDDDSTPDYGGDVAGSYDGWSSMGSAYFSDNIALDQKITVTKQTESTVAVSYVSSSLGTFSFSELPVQKSGSTYTISGAGVTEMGHSGSTSSYDCTLTATITADATTFVFSIPSVMGGTTVTFTQGDLPETQYGNVVKGSFTGYLTGTAQYFPEGMKEETESTVTVTANTDGTVNLSCTSDQWGTITVNNMEVTRDGYTFSFAGAGTAEMGMSGTTNEYVCNATCSENASTGSSDFQFVLPAVMGGLTLTLGE